MMPADAAAAVAKGGRAAMVRGASVWSSDMGQPLDASTLRALLATAGGVAKSASASASSAAAAAAAASQTAADRRSVAQLSTTKRPRRAERSDAGGMRRGGAYYPSASATAERSPRGGIVMPPPTWGEVMGPPHHPVSHRPQGPHSALPTHGQPSSRPLALPPVNWEHAECFFAHIQPVVRRHLARHHNVGAACCVYGQIGIDWG
jgi:hypothetical protein